VGWAKCKQARKIIIEGVGVVFGFFFFLDGFKAIPLVSTTGVYCCKSPMILTHQKCEEFRLIIGDTQAGHHRPSEPPPSGRRNFMNKVYPDANRKLDQASRDG